VHNLVFLCIITVLKAQAAISCKHFSQELVAVTLQNKEGHAAA
jgi:CO dehydrogenase/acetyl-CoA synthase epsilon subunit